MNNPPRGKDVDCPKCGEEAIAIVPRGSKIVEKEENADGKVIVHCRSCGNQFYIYYIID